jgi:arylsulfatase A-like enzyme
LAPEANTLAERLQAAGYRTGGFITNANVGVEFGIDQGFDVFEWYPHFKDRPNHRLRSTVQASESALQWIGKPGDEAPFFAYLHIMDPHGPYMPPKRERQQFAADVSDKEIGTGRHLKKLVALSIPVTESLRRDLSALYLAEIAYTDARLGDFLMRLDELGHREDTLVVVVSDHGEEIFDHGWSEHGKTLYAEQIHVPLVMRLPQGQLAGQRVEVAVEQIDLMPTILDLLGLLDLGIQNTIDGHSLLPLLSGQDQDPFAPAFATLAMDGRRMWSVTEGDLKLIETYEYAHPRSFHPGLQLFDLSKDPGEQVNLAAERPVAVAYLRAKYKAAQHQSSARLQPEKAILSDAVEEELRALGYLE